MAPEVPDEVMLAQGWRMSSPQMWFKLDGTPVFFADLVRAYEPLRLWVESVVPRVGEVALGDFCES